MAPSEIDIADDTFIYYPRHGGIEAVTRAAAPVAGGGFVQPDCHPAVQHSAGAPT